MEANVNLSFSQLMELVRKLPRDQKIKLSKELEKETIESKLSELLTSFYTEDLTLEDIRKEVEEVRQDLHDKRSSN